MAIPQSVALFHNVFVCVNQFEVGHQPYYICIYRLVPGPGTTYDGVGGWGGMLTFM